MLHARARHLLPRLFEDDLPYEVVLEVEAHVASCGRCQRAKQELELSEALLAKLPSAFAPLEFDAKSYARLVSLNQWSNDPSFRRRERFNAPILALASAAAIFAMAATMSHWAPAVGGAAAAIAMAGMQPDSSYIPLSWKPTWY